MTRQDRTYLTTLVLAFMLAPPDTYEELELDNLVSEAFTRLGLTGKEQMDYLHEGAQAARKSNA